MDDVPLNTSPVTPFDVAIVGFGPSGAVAAALLGQAGLRVLMVDKSREVYGKPRAISLDHEIMRVFQEIGVADAVLPHTEPFAASEHFGADGKLIRRLDMLAPPYPMGWTPSMVFLQPPVEQILRERVLALPTVQVALGLELVGLTQDADGVALQLRADNGKLQTERSHYVIGCDGASSAVRRLAGITLEDLDFDEPWLVVDVLANALGLAKLPQTSAQYCKPARPTTFIIGTGAHRRWEIMLLPGEDPRAMEEPARVWDLLAPWIGPNDAQLWRQASYRFHALLATQWRSGRVFIAGDAAHQQPPFLGQGMCQGVRDVANLCWKLSHVLDGQANDALLNTYATERSAHVRALTTTVQHIGRYICERGPQAAAERDARLRLLAGGVVKSEPRQDLVPGLTCGLLSNRPHAAHGTLFPQPRVEHLGKSSLLDDLVGRGWHVVLAGASEHWRVRPVAPMQVLRISAAPLDGAWQETQGVVAHWMQRHGCCAALVRPDHYVYAVADNLDTLHQEIDGLRPWLQA